MDQASPVATHLARLKHPALMVLLVIRQQTQRVKNLILSTVQFPAAVTACSRLFVAVMPSIAA